MSVFVVVSTGSSFICGVFRSAASAMIEFDSDDWTEESGLWRSEKRHVMIVEHRMGER